MWQKMVREWLEKFLRRQKEPQATVKVAPVVLKKYPVIDKFRQRYSPEYSPCGEELYCNGILAEDTSLRLYRDLLVPGFPVVEVHVGGEKIDLRDCSVFRTTQGYQRHPRWAYAQKKVLDWLEAHDCPEAKSPKHGFWVYDPAAS